MESLTRLPARLPAELLQDFDPSFSVVGHGAYAVVLKVKNSEKSFRACKVVEAGALQARGLLSQLETEVMVAEKVCGKHENVLGAYKVVKGGGAVWLLMELLDCSVKSEAAKYVCI